LELVARLAAELKLARATLALSRSALARRAKVADTTIRRIESGAIDVGVATLTSVFAAAGFDLVVRAYEGRTARLRDSGQLELVDQLRRAAAQRWKAVIEVAAGEYGRSADLVFYGADEVIHVEVERRATDFQAQLRSALRKREVLAGRGDRPVRLVLAVEDTRRNRVAIAEHAEAIGSRLPAGSRDVQRALRTGQPLGRDALLWIRRDRKSRRSPSRAEE
jgi:transcriptional regulator with XRE-family HTH domain